MTDEFILSQQLRTYNCSQLFPGARAWNIQSILQRNLRILESLWIFQQAHLMILQEVSPHEGGKKMCITWSVDFFWCNELPGPEVPILSGGLLAISRKWWHESGGHTSELSEIGGCQTSHNQIGSIIPTSLLPNFRESANAANGCLTQPRL